MRERFLIIAACLLLSGSTWLASAEVSGSAGAGSSVAPRAVATAADIEDIARKSGQPLRGVAIPSKQADLTSPIPGILATVAVQENQPVEQDQMLARVDDRLQQAAVESARLRAASDARIDAAALAVQDASIQLERVEGAHRDNAASDWELRQARLALEQRQVEARSAQEEKALAQVTLRLEEQRLSMYQIKAPFTGRILRLQTEPGVNVTQDTPLLTMVQLDPLEAQIFLPVGLYGRLIEGAVYRLDAGQPVNREITGRLKLIERLVDPASRTFRAVFTIDNPDEAMPAGFEVRLLGPAATDLPASSDNTAVSNNVDAGHDADADRPEAPARPSLRR